LDCPFYASTPDFPGKRQYWHAEISHRLVAGTLARSIRPGFDPSHPANRISEWNDDEADDIARRATEILTREDRDVIKVYPSVSQKLETRGSVAARAKSKRIAVHIHMFYGDLVTEVAEAFSPLRDSRTADFYLSTSSEKDRRYILSQFEAEGKVVAKVVENRGRDIGPMLTAFRGELKAGRYELIGHLHGKKTLHVHGNTGERWRRFCFDHLAKAPGALSTVLEAFDSDPELGLIFPDDPNSVGWTKNRKIAQDLLVRLGMPPLPAEAIKFPIGTMFWARPKVLQPLWDLKLEPTDYPPEPLPSDGTVLHAIERLLPTLAQNVGLKWKTIHLANVKDYR
jgi:lipopolysaccharide biosynthesis protein